MKSLDHFIQAFKVPKRFAYINDNTGIVDKRISQDRINYG